MVGVAVRRRQQARWSSEPQQTGLVHRGAAAGPEDDHDDRQADDDHFSGGHHHDEQAMTCPSRLPCILARRPRTPRLEALSMSSTHMNTTMALRRKASRTPEAEQDRRQGDVVVGRHLPPRRSSVVPHRPRRRRCRARPRPRQPPRRRPGRPVFRPDPCRGTISATEPSAAALGCRPRCAGRKGRRQRRQDAARCPGLDSSRWVALAGSSSARGESRIIAPSAAVIKASTSPRMRTRTA